MKEGLHNSPRCFRLAVRLTIALFFAMLGGEALAEQTVMDSFGYTTPSNEESRFAFKFSGQVPDPITFTTDNPARLAIDFANTALGDVTRSQLLQNGIARNIRLVSAGSRTRVVIGLTHVVPYDVKKSGNAIYVVLHEAGAKTEASRPTGTVVGSNLLRRNEITNVDFRRAENGTGRIIVTLSSPSTVIDLQTRGDKIIAEFVNTRLPEKMERRLDVADFATPVRTIDAFNENGTSRLVVSPEGYYEHLAYQIGNVYTIDIKPLTKAQIEKAKEGKFVGEKLSLNFQNIEVRAVLQLLGDFTGLNMVASDTVQGNITLRLKNVPWDQALEIILKSKGLAMRKSGNVALIAPAEEIAAREKLELEARNQIEDLAPLRTEFFQINYAKASEIAELLKAEGNSLLSKRGNVTIDERTNTLMVLETGDKLDEIRGVITRLDIPVRQVLIESRIVIATDKFSKDLGARFGVSGATTDGNRLTTTSGSLEGTDTTVASATDTSPGLLVGGLNDRLNVDLGLTGAAGRAALAILGSDYLVDLELSAMQSEGRGEVISSPRVVTANQKEAKIEQGVEIPYLQASSSGATTVAFKKAVLSLAVTPQITPDNRVVMDLKVNKDSVGEVFYNVPSINTRNVDTQVLVNNGATVVLGGIFEQTRSDEVDKVPLLGDLPILGVLFRQTRKVDDKMELLIFVTPKILKDDLNTALQ